VQRCATSRIVAQRRAALRNRRSRFHADGGGTDVSSWRPTMQNTILRLAVCSSLLGACAADTETSELEQETLGSGAVATTLATGLLGNAKTEINWGGYAAEVKGSTTLVMQEIVIQPGGHTGWHSHSGMALASIAIGTLTLFDSTNPCVGTPYPTGTAFLDPGGGHTHIARNLGEEAMTVRVQYISPTGQPVRIDAPAPSTCP
jgi:hypothetical protein